MSAKRIEAHGVKGLKSTAWRKSFASTEALLAWAEKNDAEIYAVREPDDASYPTKKEAATLAAITARATCTGIVSTVRHATDEETDGERGFYMVELVDGVTYRGSRGLLVVSVAEFRVFILDVCDTRDADAALASADDDDNVIRPRATSRD